MYGVGIPDRYNGLSVHLKKRKKKKN
jgi:hypothetical protein